MPALLRAMRYINDGPYLPGDVAQSQSQYDKSRRTTSSSISQSPDSVSDLVASHIHEIRRKRNEGYGGSYMRIMVACTTSLIDDMKKSSLLSLFFVLS